MSSTSNFAVALAWAAAGLRVFPCRASDDGRGKVKTPLVPSWQANATTDPETLEALWAQHPNAMPGLVTEGLLVIDCDRKPNIDGVEAFEKLAHKIGLDYSGAMQIKTPSGGRHLIWRIGAEPQIGNRTGVLPDGIDVRSQGRGYVIAEGAERCDGGRYIYIGGPDPRSTNSLSTLAPVPAALLDVLTQARTHVVRPAAADATASSRHQPDPLFDADADLASLDLSQVRTRRTAATEAEMRLNRVYGYVDKVVATLAATLPNFRGSTLNRLAYLLGGVCAGENVSVKVARDALLAACIQNGLVAKEGLALVERNIERALADGGARPIKLTDREQATAMPQAQTSACHSPDHDPLPWIRQDETPPTLPGWLVKRVLPHIGVAQLTGASGTGKSALALALAVRIMTGEPFFGHKIKRKGTVLWFAAEAAGDIGPRLSALKLVGEMPNDAPFYYTEGISRLLGKDAEVVLLRKIARLREKQRKCGDPEPVMLVIDTMAAGAGWTDENSSAEAQQVFSLLQRVARRENMLILLIDHTGKGGLERGTRGSSAKDAAADARLTVEKDGEGIAIVTLAKSRASANGKLGAYELVAVQIGVDEDGDAEDAIYAKLITTVTAKKPSKSLQRIQDCLEILQLAQEPVTKAAIKVEYARLGHNVACFTRDYGEAVKAGIVLAEDLRLGRHSTDRPPEQVDAVASAGVRPPQSHGSAISFVASFLLH